MRLTTKGRFAVTAMIDVAMHCGSGPVTLGGVSERQKISLSYLEQLFGKLRRSGLVESVRGPGGGYNLARATDTVSVADVIVAVDEPIDATQCGGRENCHDDRRCMTHELWTNLNTQKVLDVNSIPQALSMNLIYQTPHGSSGLLGGNKIISAAVIAALAVIVGMFFVMTDIWVFGNDVSTAFTGSYLWVLVPDLIASVILVPILALAWEPLKESLGR